MEIVRVAPGLGFVHRGFPDLSRKCGEQEWKACNYVFFVCYSTFCHMRIKNDWVQLKHIPLAIVTYSMGLPLVRGVKFSHGMKVMLLHDSS